MVASTSETNIGDVADAKSEIDSDQDEASALPAHTRHRLRVIKTGTRVYTSGESRRLHRIPLNLFCATGTIGLCENRP